jgi:riboflavin kinase / FMN adenylyltransferase
VVLWFRLVPKLRLGTRFRETPFRVLGGRSRNGVWVLIAKRSFENLRSQTEFGNEAHHSPLTTHHSPLTTHHSPLTTHLHSDRLAQMSIHTLAWDEMPPASSRGGAVAVGNFDGVHRGHRALVAELGHQARALRDPAVALTFDPHPLQLLRPEQFQPVLTNVADRAELLAAYGADQVLILKTTRDLLQLSAADFFHHVLQSGLMARALVEGVNFGFGRNREGTIQTLDALCREAAIPLTVVPPVLREGQPISSSRVRKALERGAVADAAELLDRPYRLRGTVGSGRQRGRTIGFPTANLERIETLLPGDGVYAVRVYRGSESWPGAANIGPNPTFGEAGRKVEVHLIGFQGDLLGQSLAVDFLERLRDTKPFPGVAELTAQLRRDVERAQSVAASR